MNELEAASLFEDIKKSLINLIRETALKINGTGSPKDILELIMIVGNEMIEAYTPSTENMED
ncbi:MAG TPA: hypothetical protein VHA52_09805 [Candidatus Babeliaceae bacterium]|nr:hypothetical protein [Candidatus Babeliaceae bacterium]